MAGPGSDDLAGATDPPSAMAELRARPEPTLPDRFARHVRLRALFVPEVARGLRAPADILLVTVADLCS